MAEEARLTLQGIPLVVRNKQLVDFSREISKMVAEARNNFAKSLVRIVNFVDKTFNIRGLELFVSTCRPSQPVRIFIQFLNYPPDISDEMLSRQASTRSGRHSNELKR